MLTDAQIDRYSRQIILPGVGGRGQQRLLDAHVLIVGSADGAAPSYLAAAGIGRLTIWSATPPQHPQRQYRRGDCQITLVEDANAAADSDADICLITAVASPAQRAQRSLAPITVEASTEAGAATIRTSTPLSSTALSSGQPQPASGMQAPVSTELARTVAQTQSEHDNGQMLIDSAAALEVLYHLLGLPLLWAASASTYRPSSGEWV